MFRLLTLSLVLSAPLAAAQTATLPDNPLTVESSSLALMNHGMPQQMVEEQQAAKPYDAMEIHPDADICYKIRAYIFSQGSHPKLLRETTCGPIAPATKQTDGFKPQLVPLDIMHTPTPEK